MICIKGKWALVTGAARGIGRLAAVSLAERGCNIIAHARKKAHCAALLEELQALNVEAVAVEAEFTQMDSVAKMLEEIDGLGVNVDIILNNAGMQVAYRSDYYATPASDYEESFAINTIAPMMICYHFIPGMLERGFGRVVNTTSGIRNNPPLAGYSASKAALDKVTIDLGSRLQGTNVTINLTDPGWCKTDLGGAQAPDDPEDALPGVVAGVFINDGKSGRYIAAERFHGMTLEDAVKEVETLDSPY